MERAHFTVAPEGGSWAVMTGSAHYALLPSKESAIDAALAAADAAARHGVSADVLLDVRSGDSAPLDDERDDQRTLINPPSAASILRLWRRRLIGREF